MAVTKTTKPAAKKTTTKPATKKAKTSKEEKALTMPQRSTLRLTGGAHPSSQKVKHGNKIVITEGLGVQAAWVAAFAANATHKATDVEITFWMREAFPDRQSKVFA